ncbi:MAG: hypothetical protein J2P45_15360, partial [Candidatus Dormibacteraeota bacterium]|nr:hypothetical protein [Candidatus Dormibacteraeota bacterium]
MRVVRKKDVLRAGRRYGHGRMRRLRVLGPLLRGWPGLLAAGVALSGLSIAELSHCDCRLVAQPVDPALVGALQALSILPLPLSRRWPGAALVGGGLVLLVMSLAGMHHSAFQFVAVLAMLALACLQLDQLRSAPLALAVAGGTVLVRRDAAPEEVAFEVAVVALTWALAGALGTHRRLVLALREQTRSLELAQEEAARRAGAEERARLGRELHDVVAHSLGVMVLQAAGGRRALERAPDQARGALEAIERTGRDALAEMRQALELLRPDGEDARTTPGVAAVPDLVERCRRSGLQVE